MSYLYAVRILISDHLFYPVKVGFSTDPYKRLSKHYGGFPYPVEVIGVWEGTLADEKNFHNRYAEYRLNGEWFRPTAEMLDEIDRCIHAADPYEVDDDPDWESKLTPQQARCLADLRRDGKRLDTDPEYRREQFEQAAVVMDAMVTDGAVSQEFAAECRARAEAARPQA